MSSAFAFCDSCYVTSIAWCTDPHFITGLQHAHPYRVYIENHFGQVYYQNVTTDSDGNFTLDISLFPDEFFNPSSGNFILTVKTLQGDDTDIVYGYQGYPCIVFDVYQETATN